MKETPILFTPEHIELIDLRIKRQTRRVVKLPANFYEAQETGVNYIPHEDSWRFWASTSKAVDKEIPGGRIQARMMTATASEDIACPYGGEGDRLWVKESWRTYEDPKTLVDGFLYRDGAFKAIANTREAADEWMQFHDNGKYGNALRNAMFMPRVACRMILKITQVGTERLQSISDEDCFLEGVTAKLNPKGKYQEIWNRINGKTHPWSTNPWVWKISFMEEVV